MTIKATSPKKALESILAIDKLQIAKINETIEDNIGTWDGLSPIKVRISGFEAPSKYTMRTIEEAYEKAGWKVKTEQDKAEDVDEDKKLGYNLTLTYLKP